MRSFEGLGVPVPWRRGADRAPRPLLAALPQILLALVVLGVGLANLVAWPWIFAVAGSLVFVGLLQAGSSAIELERRRRAADEWLLWGATARPSSALLSWRATELSSPKMRSTLAHSLRRIEREVRGGTLPGAVPLNRRAIRVHLNLVRALAARLDDSARPASVKGTLLVDRLLTEPGSPLYSPVPDDVLAEAITEALAALDPERAAAAAA